MSTIYYKIFKFFNIIIRLYNNTQFAFGKNQQKNDGKNRKFIDRLTGKIENSIFIETLTSTLKSTEQQLFEIVYFC